MKVFRLLSRIFKRRIVCVIMIIGFIPLMIALFSTFEQQTVPDGVLAFIRHDGVPVWKRQGQVTSNSSLRAKNGVLPQSSDFPTRAYRRKQQIPAWQLFTEDVKTKETLYNPGGGYLPKLLQELATTEIKNISIMMKGTQLKFWIHFVDGNQALAKPMRDPKDLYIVYKTKGDFIRERERHTAEIAAFHLDRIFDFRRVAPCIGRALDFTADIIMKTNDPAILDTQRIKDGNLCFIGDCTWKFLCNESALTCAKDGILEVSVCQAIPQAIMRSCKYPWVNVQLTSEAHVLKICQEINERHVFYEHNFFLDFMETVAFDHLMVNQDRHNHRIIKKKRTGEVGLGLLDNGKGFGNPFIDDPGFLLPFKICCRFRNSTYWKFKEFTKPGHMLGDLMRASLAQDPINPVLTEDFFPALNRRLSQVLSEIDRCIEKFGRKTVLLES